ncbi:MAG: DUF4129 domain-containing protein [Mediterranea sp.]|jgi:hypothetical protein|nr:DUF4129 domain-containing protein [Mediterranea sp.]
MLDRLPGDTLVIDTALVAQWQSMPRYQYNRELFTPEVNFWEWLMRQIDEWLYRLFNSSNIAPQYAKLILITLGVLLVAAVIWMVYKKNIGLFVGNRTSRMPYRVTEDTIYGVDFPHAIADALAAHDYREAMRLLYLQTLKQLSDAQLIRWELYKTPTEYLREVPQPALEKLTYLFLRIRYGNFEATAELYHSMTELQRGLFGDLAAAADTPHNTKGGEV